MFLVKETRFIYLGKQNHGSGQTILINFILLNTSGTRDFQVFTRELIGSLSALNQIFYFPKLHNMSANKCPLAGAQKTKTSCFGNSVVIILENKMNLFNNFKLFLPKIPFGILPCIPVYSISNICPGNRSLN